MTQSKRLLSIDVLRGLTIFGMILVNQAGACGYAYAPLRHAKWDGFTPADLVFPAFMVVMGMSIFLSLNKNGFDFKSSIGHILKRTALIILVGVVLKWVLSFIETGTMNTLDNLRLMGVLQRLGICYGIVAVMGVTIKHRLFPIIAAMLLLAYFMLQVFFNGFEKCADNIVSIVDYAVLGQSHMYLQGSQFVDPEGVLSTLPAVAQVMIGFCIGRIVAGKCGGEHKTMIVALIGAALLIAGYLWSFGCPINKRLWSPSFTLVTSGSTVLLLAIMMYVVDLREYKRWSFPFKVVGVNPLFIYVLSEMAGDALRRFGINDFLFQEALQPVFGNYLGSLMYAVMLFASIWAIAYVMYKKKIFIKL